MIQILNTQFPEFKDKIQVTRREQMLNVNDIEVLVIENFIDDTDLETQDRIAMRTCALGIREAQFATRDKGTVRTTPVGKEVCSITVTVKSTTRIILLTDHFVSKRKKTNEDVSQDSEVIINREVILDDD